jgi:hypothetical protein
MQNFDHTYVTLVFDKNANFFAENCQKSQKIVIITSTPAANRQQVSELSFVHLPKHSF